MFLPFRFPKTLCLAGTLTATNRFSLWWLLRRFTVLGQISLCLIMDWRTLCENYSSGAFSLLIWLGIHLLHNNQYRPLSTHQSDHSEGHIRLWEMKAVVHNLVPVAQMRIVWVGSDIVKLDNQWRAVFFFCQHWNETGYLWNTLYLIFLQSRKHANKVRLYYMLHPVDGGCPAKKLRTDNVSEEIRLHMAF